MRKTVWADAHFLPLEFHLFVAFKAPGLRQLCYFFVLVSIMRF